MYVSYREHGTGYLVSMPGSRDVSPQLGQGYTTLLDRSSCGPVSILALITHQCCGRRAESRASVCGDKRPSFPAASSAWPEQPAPARADAGLVFGITLRYVSAHGHP